MKNKTHKRITGDEDYVIYTETNRRRRITKKYVAAGSWTCKENEIYLHFLENHPYMFESEFIRRSTKVFRKMSSMLKRRDPEQCRSHHQKLVIKFDGDIKGITEKLKMKITKAKLKTAALEEKEKKNKLKTEKKRLEREEKNKMLENSENYEEKMLATGDRNCMFTGEYLMKQLASGDVEIIFNLDLMESW